MDNNYFRSQIFGYKVSFLIIVVAMFACHIVVWLDTIALREKLAEAIGEDAANAFGIGFIDHVSWCFLLFAVVIFFTYSRELFLHLIECCAVWEKLSKEAIEFNGVCYSKYEQLQNDINKLKEDIEHPSE
jgi:hypothetical protein